MAENSMFTGLAKAESEESKVAPLLISELGLPNLVCASFEPAKESQVLSDRSKPIPFPHPERMPLETIKLDTGDTLQRFGDREVLSSPSKLSPEPNLLTVHKNGNIDVHAGAGSVDIQTYKRPLDVTNLPDTGEAPQKEVSGLMVRFSSNGETIKIENGRIVEVVKQVRPPITGDGQPPGNGHGQKTGDPMQPTKPSVSR